MVKLMQRGGICGTRAEDPLHLLSIHRIERWLGMKKEAQTTWFTRSTVFAEIRQVMLKTPPLTTDRRWKMRTFRGGEGPP
jgi:hypothetical protein